MLKGLIFDLDGTLTDTATYHVRAWNRLAQQIGIDLSNEQVNSLRGLGRTKAMELILQYGHAMNKYSDQEKAQLIKQKNQMFISSLQKMRPADLYPGMGQLLRSAKKQGLKIALASNSKNAPRVVKQLGIYPLFDAIVDPGKLHKRKPDPEIYITAQKLLHLAANEVISFEDSPKGVKAIKAAHQFAVGIGQKEWPVPPDYQVNRTSQLSLAKLEQAFNK